ncbi:HAD family hydrolase [Mycoplasma buteonis]|uniref:HAD family hydrolase n=1 Tax=Mycoplasma buteonis TaxID=171280 RepID=UPI0005669CAE|nr:HAD family hydrolase [Mycoplasma buteonis]
MKRIFAYDLDGTLLMSNNKVHPNTTAAMKKTREAGHIHVLATGRGIQKVLPLINRKDIQFIDYMVCSNGAAIYDLKNQKLTVVKKMDKEAFDVALKLALKHESILTVDTDKYNGTYFPNDKMPSWISEKQVMDMNVVDHASIEKLSNIVTDPNNIVTQMALRNPNHKAKEITEEMRSLLDPNKYEVYLTNLVYTDVNPQGTSKWNGLLELAKLINWPSESIVTFGDSGNDLEMLTKANLSFTMSNAAEDVKQISQNIIGHHETDTIGETLLKFINE